MTQIFISNTPTVFLILLIIFCISGQLRFLHSLLSKIGSIETRKGMPFLARTFLTLIEIHWLRNRNVPAAGNGHRWVVPSFNEPRISSPCPSTPPSGASLISGPRGMRRCFTCRLFESQRNKVFRWITSSFRIYLKHYQSFINNKIFNIWRYIHMWKTITVVVKNKFLHQK